MFDDPKTFLNSLPRKPGVYEMYDAKRHILYVGKAKNLKKRLASYFRAALDAKTQALMAEVANIEIIVTPNENTSLLLESNLIKTKKPHYNILFKDDKSFPYIFLSRHNYPRLSIYRGAIDKTAGKYFGPFPDASAVNFVVELLQKIFQLRVCKDSFLRHRSRPCMLHQIKLCSAPCVGCIDHASYARQVKLVEQFLRNQSDYVIKQLTRLMDLASEKMMYEQAAEYRDQIASIRKVQSEQAIITDRGNIDELTLVTSGKDVGINILFIRNGLLLGNKTYFPETHNSILSEEEMLAAFIMHFYWQSAANLIVPDKILVNLKLQDKIKIAQVLHEASGHKVIISDRIRGPERQLIMLAKDNADNALKNRANILINYAKNLLEFKRFCKLRFLPRRIECFDVSHTYGEATVASCIVFNEKGPSKKDYLRFNVKSKSMGDDYGALREVLERRFRDSTVLPDVLMIDGGRGQLNVASQVLQTLGVKNVFLIAIAKGKERKRGQEEIYLKDQRAPLVLPQNSPALHLIQQIRDEAHRYAISGHRKKLAKSRYQSELEKIPGIGKAKRSLLLRYFGGISELQSVSIDELARVSGIGSNLAKRIYEHLHA